MPDPEKDEITGVFYCYQNEDDTLRDTTTHRGYHAGFVVIDSPQIRNGRLGLEGIPCHVVNSELELVNWVIDTVKAWDPDVLAGWELHNSSWGWLSARANEQFSEFRPSVTATDPFRYRLSGAAVKGGIGSFGAQEGFLLCHPCFNIQGLGSTRAQHLADLPVRGQLDSVHVRECGVSLTASEVDRLRLLRADTGIGSRIIHLPI